jgi:fatty acid desaturase
MAYENPTTNTYPAIHFLVRHGHTLAIAVAVVICLSGIAAAVAGWGWVWVPAGVVLGALAYLLFRSYAEIVQVIAETLLPR